MSRDARTVDPFDPGPDPELEELIRMIKRDVRLAIRTHVPARVIAFDPATQTCSLQVEILQVVKVTDPTKLPRNMLIPPNPLDGVNGVATLQPLKLMQIPVGFWATMSGAAYVSLPVTAGDTGTLHVHDRSIAAWRQLGAATDPYLAFTHMLQDSEFYPTLRPMAGAIAQPIDVTALVIEGPQVKLGRNATSVALKGTELVAAIDAGLTAAISAAGAIVPPAGDSGVAAFTALQVAWNAAKASFQSIKVKVE